MNDFDKSKFVGKQVEQVRCAPGNEKFLHRRGVIQDAMVDEKGTIHCQTDDGVWCPFFLLAEESSIHHRTEEDEGPTSQPEDPPPSKDFEGGF
jgi:hypothetical protein